LETEGEEHFGEYMIGRKAKNTRLYLYRPMTIAQMVRSSGKELGVARPNFHERFLRSDHAKDATVFTREAVAAAKDGAAVEKERHLLAALEPRTLANLASLLERQDELGVGVRLRGNAPFDDQHRDSE
jgi:hypothetical protein